MTEAELASVLAMDDSASRPWRVLQWADTLDATNPTDAASFWRVVVEEWSGFDAIPHESFADLFRAFASTAPGAAHLPERFTVYRGQDYDAPLGLSWSLDRSVANGFARGHRGIRHRTPYVFERSIHRNEAAFFTNEREEAEVVLIALPIGNES